MFIFLLYSHFSHKNSPWQKRRLSKSRNSRGKFSLHSLSSFASRLMNSCRLCRVQISWILGACTKFVSPKISGNSIVTWIAGWREDTNADLWKWFPQTFHLWNLLPSKKVPYAISVHHPSNIQVQVIHISEYFSCTVALTFYFILCDIDHSSHSNNSISCVLR